MPTTTGIHTGKDGGHSGRGWVVTELVVVTELLVLLEAGAWVVLVVGGISGGV